MKNKFLAVILCLLITVPLVGTVLAAAEGNENTVDAAESLFDGIVAYNLKKAEAQDIQSWIDGALAQGAGQGSEWYVLALSQHGVYDFSRYEAGLLKYLGENDVYNASSRLKYALCFSAVGGTEGYISAAMNECVGTQGIMSLIFGLHMLNNGYLSDRYTVDAALDALLALQCEDGGWSLSGGSGDVDVTAMALQALAPHYLENQDVHTRVEKSLIFLSERQLPDGDYSSYGAPNPESTAQVLVAISGLGIDCMSDTRFIKNGNTLIDGMQKYRLPDGSFCHALGGASNETATVQVFYALAAYLRMLDGGGPLYMLDRADPDNVEPAPSPTPELPSDKEPSDSDKTTDGSPSAEKNGSYKPVVCMIIVGAGAAVCLILFLLKKRHFKNFLAVIAVVAVAVCAVCLTNFRSADDYYGGTGKKKENVIGSVTVTVRCDNAVGKSDAEYIPADGVILPAEAFELAEGETVYDILVEAASKHGIQIDHKGKYISAINYLYEQALGELSGWMYRVNGVSPSVGCGEYKLSDGDVIEWLYTCDLGNDLK